MIENKYTKTVSVIRNVWQDESGYSYSGEAEVATFKGHLQQIAPEQATNLGLNITTTFSLWCSPTANILSGDKVEIDGDYYSVKLIQDNSFVGINKHKEVVLEKQDEVEVIES